MTEARTRYFVGGTVALAAAAFAAAALLLPPASRDQVEAAVFFSLAGCVAHVMAYRLPRGGFGDIMFIPLLAGVAVVPALPIVTGTAIAMGVAEYLRKNAPIRALFNTSQLTAGVGLASLAYFASGGAPLSAGTWVSDLGPFVVAFATFVVCNAVLFAGVISTNTREPLSDVLFRVLGGASIVYDLVGIPLVLGFAYAYVRIGWAWSGALLIPLFGLRLVYKANRELQTVNEELLQLMVAAIEARDPYTSGHSQRVAEYSELIASTVGLGARATQRVRTTALLHDVGKIHEEFAVVLRKPARLTEDEYEAMKGHAGKGAQLVAKVSQLADIVAPIRAHHEAWDGSGYPDRLRGEAIPVWARIIAIADTIDAMTTDRPYRRALTLDEVRAEIVAKSGRQFDPSLVRTLTTASEWGRIESAVLGAHHGETFASGAAAVTKHPQPTRDLVRT
ncbi:MAG: HD domain-containing protein [Gemmatimonadaceae bacterium]|nr:HD domain-containing protein [Gemmatimonadaceae bacterium]